MKPRALDLYCCAGGATKGLQRVGYHVTGVDIRPQPNYCGDEFIQADALSAPVDLRSFDFIWASPPCQAHVSLRGMWNAKDHADLIPATRAMLVAAGVPFVMENVPGAPLRAPILLCGTMFGLGAGAAELRRHRHFETGPEFWLFPHPMCSHKRERVIGAYGGGGKDKRRRTNGQEYPVTMRREAMGIDWMTGAELNEAIPPAYSECIGRAALNHQRAIVA